MMIKKNYQKFLIIFFMQEHVVIKHQKYLLMNGNQEVIINT
nr:MAG TPA: hypothetical protein [Caudoviricetes sp.]